MSKETRDKIKFEIEKESTRFVCPDYQGVIFVHPDDVKYTMEVMLPYTEKFNLRSKEVTLKDGGMFKVATVEGSVPHHNYVGCLLASVLISNDCFGKTLLEEVSSDKRDYSAYTFTKVGTVSPSEFILYMNSRCRCSPSQFHSHMVLF